MKCTFSLPPPLPLMRESPERKTLTGSFRLFAFESYQGEGGGEVPISISFVLFVGWEICSNTSLYIYFISAHSLRHIQSVWRMQQESAQFTRVHNNWKMSGTFRQWVAPEKTQHQDGPNCQNPVGYSHGLTWTFYSGKFLQMSGEPDSDICVLTYLCKNVQTSVLVWK